jgi:hypothetical protein
MEHATVNTVELRGYADSVTQTFSMCEQACLDTGIGLGEAAPKFGELAALFNTLSRSLDGAEFRNASVDLEEVAECIDIIGNGLEQESVALDELTALNKPIAHLIAHVAADMRIISALIFNVKIEAAILHDEEANMIGFADELRRLSTKASQALEDYQSTHLRLFDSLVKSRNSQVQFENEFRSQLTQISKDIASSLATVYGRRRAITKNLANIGDESQKIEAQIGQAVFALQVGDSTRQRIEHVREALHLAASLGERDDSFSDSETLELNQSLIAQLCRLESRQINAALDQFDGEMRTTQSLLVDLNGKASRLALQGAQLFGGNSRRDYSFLEQLQPQLKIALTMLDECRRARSNLDETTRAVDTTTSVLQELTAGLTDIVNDITMIGLNTILKSSHLKERGRCLSVIAHELQAYATGIAQRLTCLPSALAKVTAKVQQFSEAGRGHDSEYIHALGERMRLAVRTIEDCGGEMSAALSLLDSVTNQIRTKLQDALSRLSVCDDIREDLLAASCWIETMAAKLPEAWAGGAIAERLFADVRATYTMASERHVHDEFLQDCPGFISSNNRVGLQAMAREDSDLASACLF